MKAAVSLVDRLQRIYDRLNGGTFRAYDSAEDRDVARIEMFPAGPRSRYVVTIDLGVHGLVRTIALISPFLISEWAEKIVAHGVGGA